jgi:two-component system chemotaxis sensor kinase CheA
MADTSIRVDVQLLDKLMTLMGELVLARNQIVQHTALEEDSGFLGTVQRLNLLTTELQASVMKTRMQPIGNVLGKFPRIVRDLAVACGKKVRFEMEGQETELDRTLLEAIRDPLTHVVRNAIDHGIETPDVRRSRGKSEEGRLRMVAFHEGGKVMVEIADDGGGIDVARVRDKAIQNALVTPEAAGRTTQQELLQLVFLPGFSTADRVTQFSGRGVGMDVVRTNIEKIGGTVDLETSPGQGTTLRIKIPLTLAIIPALIIASGGERYAIPQVSLLELVRLDSEQAKQGIEWLHGAPVYRLRGKLLPLVLLNEQLELESAGADETNIVVLAADERQFGLVVDAIRDTEEIVVKPLQKQLKGVSVFAGASIMGDGRVALVLDVLGLAQRANVVSASKSRAIAEQERPATQSAQTESLLLFAPTAGGQMAIPLSQVARLEEFARTRLENVGARQVVQYRGEILSLIDVSDALDRLQTDQPRREGDVARASDSVPVVVYSQDNRQAGLLVDRILDIVADPIATRFPGNRPGVLFTAVVQDKVTEIVDVPALLNQLN